MDIFKLPKFATVLLDSNFFIDLFGHDEKYKNIFQNFKESGITLVSIDLVKCEFIRSKAKETTQKKSFFLSEIIEAILPVDQEINGLVQPTIEEYGVDSENLDITDIYLACFLKKYRKLYLLTRNHHHFPTRIFSRSNIFNIELAKEIKTYAFYQYLPEKTELIVEQANND